MSSPARPAILPILIVLQEHGACSATAFLGSIPPILASEDYSTVQQWTLADATSSACHSVTPSNEEHQRHHAMVPIALL